MKQSEEEKNKAKLRKSSKKGKNEIKLNEEKKSTISNNIDINTEVTKIIRTDASILPNSLEYKFNQIYIMIIN